MIDTQPKNAELPPLKPEDIQYFDKLLMEVDESTLSKEELIEREIMTYLLKIKNGTPPQRKSGLRKITENARRFGAGALFNQILPLLMSPTLEDQERHLMVKVRTLDILSELIYISFFLVFKNTTDIFLCKLLLFSVMLSFLSVSVIIVNGLRSSYRG